jgi:hypothetical protein
VRRELEIAFRARVTWVVSAVAALLVGHGFVLAVDLFSASSRSALAGSLQAREMDPLAGIVRPTLGGVDLALVLLAPLVAARTLAIEKERRTFGALCLAEGSTTRVVAKKTAAAALACSLLLGPPIVLFVAYVLAGGHIDLVETSLAIAGEALRALVVVGASLAGAAWTQTLAQAAAIGVAVSLSSWAIDAAEGFAALAWLGGASAWSIERELIPFGKGTLSIGASLWLAGAAVTAFGLACAGASFERAGRKLGAGLAVVLGGALVMAGARSIRRAYDLTEARRVSLPAAVTEELRAIRGPIELDVYFDRDDARRQQLEADVLAKLVLARPDVVIRTPLDDASDVALAQHDINYGRIAIRAGGGSRETRSTSRREIVTLVLESAGRTPPEWTQPAYPGYPAVMAGARRNLLLALAYLALPLVMLAAGLRFGQRRTQP